MKRVLYSIVVVAGTLAGQSGFRSDLAEARVCGSESSDDASPRSADAAWVVLAGCVDDPVDVDGVEDVEKAWARIHGCGEAARTIVRVGSNADHERLWSVFDELPEDSQVGVDVLDAFLDQHVERAMAAVETSTSPVAHRLCEADLEIPEFLREASAELQQAWRTYQDVVEVRGSTRERRPAEVKIPFQSNAPAFRRAAAGFLRERLSATEAAAELSRYEWGGWCGTGSHLLYEPQSKALLIAHLQLGRPDLALAASAGLGASVFAARGDATRWDRRLLAASGLDWEAFHLGGVLSGQTDLADVLARHGSERAARQVCPARPGRDCCRSASFSSRGLSDRGGRETGRAPQDRVVDTGGAGGERVRQRRIRPPGGGASVAGCVPGSAPPPPIGAAR